MSLGIGIDTGGTYTDAVVFDFHTKQVLAKGKSLTTREDLSIGIAGALDCLPAALIQKARLMALSTTLATNACVERKGGRAKLVLIGMAQKVLTWVDAKSVYGLEPSEVLCVETTQPDWGEITREEADWFGDAQALSVAAVGALQDGAVLEKTAAAFLGEKYGVPLVMANQVANELNAVERGATALLNARLLPVINGFMAAVADAAKKRNMEMPAMVVRSDGSLMKDSLSKTRPVETILSGPASSVLGGRGLTNCGDCLIVDIGGTTTDISIVEDNVPVMTGGIRIGGWRTQVKGVYIDTFGLGGDSRILLKEGKPELSARRAEPMCVALKRWPYLKQTLERILGNEKLHTHQLYEILYLVREPGDLSAYSSREQALLERLRKGPCMLGETGLDLYNLKSERLEDEGIVMRCGLTPTDIMHIRGDFCLHDREGAVLAARYAVKAMGIDFRDDAALEALCKQVYDLVCKKLYENLVRIMLLQKYPALLEKGSGEQLAGLIAHSWEEKDWPVGMLKTTFFSCFTLVGIGAPTHIFLPEVARALGAQCLIPEHAEVANAVGAIIADIRAVEKVEITPVSDGAAVTCYAVYTREGERRFDSHEEAVDYAEEAAKAAARAEARSRGAIGELYTETKVENRVAYSKEGAAVELGTVITASARSVPEG